MQHARSSMHKEAVMKMKLIKQPSVMARLNTQVEVDQKFHREMLLKQLSTLQFLLRQGLAIRGHEELEGNLQQLLLLLCEDWPQLRQWIESKKYLPPEIVNELICSMAHQVLRGILQDVREAGVFSIIADEATDVSNKEQLCLSLRWVDDSLAIHETPVEFIAVPKNGNTCHIN